MKQYIGCDAHKKYSNSALFLRQVRLENL